MSGDRRDTDQRHDEPKNIVVRVKALESLLLEKGLVDERGMNEIIETYEHNIGPRTPQRG